MAYSYNKQLKFKSKLLSGIVLAGFAMIAALYAVLPSINVLQGMASAKGGAPGDSVTYVVRYNAATCPIPESVKADYIEILSCGLVKRTGQTKNYFIKVDGFTTLTPIVRVARGSATVTLPCGNVVNVPKFTETAFAQTSPVPPPYRLYTESIKFADSCL